MSKSTKENILHAVIELLWQHSYGSVSVEDICRVAGIQKGSFYHYFPSKVDVVTEAFEQLWQSNRVHLDTIFSASLPPLERLERYCELAYRKQKEKFEETGKVLGCPYVTCGCELSTLEERVRLKMNDLFIRSAKYFESLLRDAKALHLTNAADPVATSQEMLSYVAGIMYQAKLKNDIEVIRRDLKPGLLRYFTVSTPSERVDHTVNSMSDIHAGHC